MIDFPQEDYSSLESIRRTGNIAGRLLEANRQQPRRPR